MPISFGLGTPVPGEGTGDGKAHIPRSVEERFIIVGADGKY